MKILFNGVSCGGLCGSFPGYYENPFVSSSYRKGNYGINYDIREEINGFLEIPHKIKGKGGGSSYLNMTNYHRMFDRGNMPGLKGVISTNKDIYSMTYMFNEFGRYNTNEVQYLDLSRFYTGNVVNMRNMFLNAKINLLDLSNFDTSKVTNMSSMFSKFEGEILGLSSFDTSNVINMSGMFYAYPEETLDLSSFDTSNVVDSDRMFKDSKIKLIYARTEKDAAFFKNQANLDFKGSIVVEVKQ